MESQNCGILTKYIWGAPIKREFLLLYLIIKMSSIFRPQLFSDAFPVKGRQNSVKILHRSQSSLPLISFSSGRGLYFRFTLEVLPNFLSNWHNPHCQFWGFLFTFWILICNCDEKTCEIAIANFFVKSQQSYNRLSSFNCKTAQQTK